MSANEEESPVVWRYTDTVTVRPIFEVIDDEDCFAWAAARWCPHYGWREP
jgi:hypothetical protein